MGRPTRLWAYHHRHLDEYVEQFHEFSRRLGEKYQRPTGREEQWVMVAIGVLEAREIVWRTGPLVRADTPRWNTVLQSLFE